jgi:hypothetical protein
LASARRRLSGGHIGPEVGRPVHPPERGVLTASKLARAVRLLAAGSSALDDARRLRGDDAGPPGASIRRHGGEELLAVHVGTAGDLLLLGKAAELLNREVLLGSQGGGAQLGLA